MEHLADGGDVALEEDGDRPVGVHGHVVKEPPAKRYPYFLVFFASNSVINISP